MTYDFATQLRAGIKGERTLDEYFEQSFTITPASTAQQRQGIDRLFVHRRTGQPFTVEYKTDTAAARTHNAFIETISVDNAGKPGWVYSSQADVLIYYIPGDGLAYVIRFTALRKRLPLWLQRYPCRRVPNDGYHTVGLLVPLAELERVAHEAVCP